LEKVVVDEKDMAKAVSVAGWVEWVVEQGGGEGTGREIWEKALGSVRDGVQKAVERRGLGSLAL